VYFNSVVYFYMHAICFDIYSDLPQECQYKKLKKENTIKRKGSLFRVTIFVILKQNVQYKSVRPVHNFKNVHTKTFV